jgi:hypothetical protein
VFICVNLSAPFNFEEQPAPFNSSQKRSEAYLTKAKPIFLGRSGFNQGVLKKMLVLLEVPNESQKY